jgi:iron complex transport system permease protein
MENDFYYMSKSWIRILLWIMPVPVIFVSVFIGASGHVGFGDVIDVLLHPFDETNSLPRTIIFDIRLPRILLVFITGGVLSVSGAAFQAIFRNPLVDPYILGLSSGAAFGAALGLVIPFIPVQVSAFAFGLAAVALSYYMARKKKVVSIISLILAGIIANGIFTALLTIVQVIADPFKLQSIVHWLMGNFQQADWDQVKIVIFPATAGLLVLYALRWKLNVLALGDEEAHASGVNPSRLKIWVMLAATIASSAVVSVAGIIGLYGLVIPHMVRMLFGVDNKITLVINLVLGGSFLVLIDNISRTAAGFEIPIGVFTMLFGAPLFIWLLKKSGIVWQQ